MKNWKIKLLVLLFTPLFLAVRASAADSGGMTNAQVEAALKGYEEPGYKFVEKLNDGMWKAIYSRPGWKFGWEVVIASTSDNPEESFVVIGTTVLTTPEASPELMLQLLTENSLDTNPGNYSLFKENDVYSVQYAVKIPQTLLSEDILKEAIGFVAGYSNSRLKALEKLAPQQPSGDGGEQPSPGEEKAPAK